MSFVINPNNQRANCYVCKEKFMDPYRLDCINVHCKGTTVCGDCLKLGNEAFRIGEKCLFCRSNSIIAILPVFTPLESPVETSVNSVLYKAPATETLQTATSATRPIRAKKPPTKFAANPFPSRKNEVCCDGCYGSFKIKKCGASRTNRACGQCVSKGVDCVLNGKVLIPLSVIPAVNPPLPTKSYQIITVHSDSEDTETDTEMKKLFNGEHSDDDEFFLKSDRV